jgi:hypothetical protein
MSAKHLEHKTHYTLTIKGGAHTLYTAHIQLAEDDTLHTTELIKDEDRIDETNAVLEQVNSWRFYDRLPPRPRGQHNVYIWGWETADWERADDQPASSSDQDFYPF